MGKVRSPAFSLQRPSPSKEALLQKSSPMLLQPKSRASQVPLPAVTARVLLPGHLPTMWVSLTAMCPVRPLATGHSILFVGGGGEIFVCSVFGFCLFFMKRVLRLAQWLSPRVAFTEELDSWLPWEVAHY